MPSLAGGSCICWNELRVQLDGLMVSETNLWPDTHLADVLKVAFASGSELLWYLRLVG